MPPKRARAAAKQASSQPLPAAPAPPTRTSGRKRRHSDGSNASSMVSDAPSAQGTAAVKRRKKGKAAAQPEPEVIMEENEQMIEDVVQPTEVPNNDTTSVLDDSHEKHVHFGGNQEDHGEKSSASHITPHPRKMSIKRRHTGSSLDGGTTATRRIKTTRTSLPASLSQDGASATTIIRELQFSTLRAVLEERVRRLKEHQHSGLDIDSDMLDDLLVLESQEQDIKYPDLPPATPATPSTPSAFSRLRSLITSKAESTETLSQSATRTEAARSSYDTERRTWEAERTRFQDAILALSHEAEEAKARLRILTIELESFGFAEGASMSMIVQSIRESFESARELFEIELIGSLPDDASFRDVVEILITSIKEFAARLRIQDKELREKDDVITDLSEQVNALLDRLAQTELRKSTLEQQWHGLDDENEEKARTIEELEEELPLLREERDGIQAQLVERTTEVELLLVEKTEFEQTIDKLSSSLEGYRVEESRLTTLITRMEKEHAKTVANMNRERQQTVQDLEDRLDVEVTNRGNAEKYSEELRVAIETLETRIETIVIERDTLTETLITIRSERDAESSAKETVQADLDDKNLQIEDLEGRVDRLEDELSELTIELDKLRRLNEVERKQLENVELELDECNVEIGDLNSKLREAGTQANELRQKLFEIQQRHSSDVERLETDLAEREERFQTDLAAEVERREDADELAQEREATIITLQARLKEIEERMALLVREKDARIAELDAIIVERDQDIQDLESDLCTAEDRLDSEVEQHRLRVDELQSNISTLEETIEEHETTIRTLESEAVKTTESHTAQLERRNTTITDLNATIADLRTNISSLQTQKDNLERRVEDEAEQMLALQNANADEVATLQATIRETHDKILVIQEKARQADARWQEVVSAREEELSILQTEQQSSEETVETITQQNVLIKEKFAAYVHGASTMIRHLQEALAAARAVADDEGEAFVEEGEALLLEIDSMASWTQVSRTTNSATKSKTVQRAQKSSSASIFGSASTSSSAKKKATKGRMRRFWDSGIGVDDTVQPEMEEV